MSEAAVAHQSHYDPSTVTVIEPSRGWRALGLREVWDYRELLYFLVWRDLKIRYKQTGVGVVWALLQPFLVMVLFAIVFGHFARLPTNGIPYALLAFSGLMPWLLFTAGLQNATTSIVTNQQLVTKVYFPRVLIPTAPVLAAGVDFLLSFLILGGLLAWYGVVPTIWLLTLPLLMAFAMATALAVGLWLSALNVRYRDVQYTIPFLIQLWFFATPIAYSPLIFPDWLRPYIGLNPMAGVAQAFRWALFGDQAGRFAFRMMSLSALIVAVLLGSGLAYFRRTEKSFADVI
jgi:lipopolysaccharide transport system permease protein